MDGLEERCQSPLFVFSWQIAERLLYEHWKKNNPKLREVKTKEILPLVCLSR